MSASLLHRVRESFDRFSSAGIALAVLAFAARGQSTLLNTEYELRDGEIVDIAAQPDATSTPSAKRMWLAQGRVRAAMELGAGARQYAEDRWFDGVQPQLMSTVPPAGTYHEQPLLVEVDATNARLYTLTDKTLYREGIATPSAPAPEAHVLLSSVLPVGEHVRDMRIWTARQLIALLTEHYIVLLKNTASAISFVSQTETFSFPLHDHSGAMYGLQVMSFDRMTLAQDVDNHVLAYVLAQMQVYGGAGTGVGRPYPRLMLVCDLGSGSNFSSPHFDFVASGSPGPEFRFFNPVPPPIPGPTCFAPRYGAFDVAVHREGASQIAYLACGEQRQIVRLDVTNALTTPIVELAQIQVDPPPPSSCSGGRRLQRVGFSPSNPNHLIVFTQYGSLWVYDVSTGQSYSSSGSESFRTMLGDIATVQYASPAATVWSTSSVDSDYSIKHFDVSTLSAGTPLVLLDQLFWPCHSDGGVAIPEWNSIYLLTFGGVVRYEKQGSDWRAVTSSYQPAEVPPNSGVVYATEHIWLERDVASPGDHRLFVTTALGGFIEFRIDPFTHDPLPPTVIPPPPTSNIDPTWISSDPLYGNDIACVRVAGNPWVLCDVANRRTTSPAAALLAYAWDSTLNTWKYATAASWSTGVVQAQHGPSNTYNIHVTGGATPTAFVCFENGFASVRLTLGPPVPSMKVASKIYEYTGGTGQFKLCCGMGTFGDKLFVAFGNGDASPYAAVRTYQWDPATSQVGAVLHTLTDLDICQQSGGVIGEGSMTCSTNAVAIWKRSFRARFHANAAGTCGSFYVCGDKILLELAYNSAIQGLIYSHYWASDYTLPLQDCHRYEFVAGSPRLLVVKDSESFALVEPTSCP